MLFKSITHLKTSTTLFSMNTLGIRCFATKAFGSSSGKLADNFNFPKHKEFFNDMYYQQEEGNSETGAYGKNTEGPATIGKDYVDPNEPFLSENKFAPGGILAHYKKRAGLTA